MTKKHNRDWNVQFAFGAAILALLVAGGIVYRCVVMTNDSCRLIDHTNRIINTLSNLLASMESIESGALGFVMTGDQSYLALYHAGLSSTEKNSDEIRALTRKNSQQQKHLAVVESLIDQKTQMTEKILAVRQTQGLLIAGEILREAPYQHIMVDFRSAIDAMRHTDLQVLVLLNQDIQIRYHETKIIILLETMLGLLIIALIGRSSLSQCRHRRFAEITAQENEDNFNVIANNITQLAWMADANGSIFWFNQRWFDYTGTTLSDMLAMEQTDWEKVLHPEHQRRVVDCFRHCVGTGEIWEDTFQLRGAEATYHWFFSRAVPIHDSLGKITRWFGTNTDISASKEAELQVGQMEGRYRALLEAAPDAMVVVNKAGEIVLVNAQAEKQFGYHRDELLGQPVTNIIQEGFAERLIADEIRNTEEAMAQRMGTGVELSGRRKDRSLFPIEIMLSPMESAEGVLVTAAIRDISVRKAAENRLGQMEARYRGLLEAAPDAMVVVNAQGNIVLLNVQAEKQFGYRRDELVGQNLKNIIPEGFDERLIADGLRSTEEALAQQMGTGIELIGRRKLGTEFPIEIMLSPLESAEGILVTAAIRDITARKTAEVQLLSKIEELNRSNEELGQFAYIASHDLQEPLRMVASYTQLLAKRYKGQLDSDADDFIDFAVDGANRMQWLIQDLLTYSRVGTQGKELLKTPSENALRQALTNLSNTIKESGAVVTHDPLPFVMADEIQLTQLFQNLIGNGIKYQNMGTPEVHISALLNSKKQWLFSVKDNGLGIEAQYFEKIFGMFQRLHKREEFSGTGIGLAICKKIVERHGGRISVESKVGQGSTFRFTLNGNEWKPCN